MHASKRSRKTALERTHSNVPSTNVDNMVWQRWCRLCAKENPESNLCVFPETETPGCVMDNTLATAIGKFFWVNMRPNDEISKFLCLECHTLITSLINFTERVNKVQAMFCILQNTSSANIIDLNEIRLQYGLLDDDWEHVIQHECAAEDNKVEYKDKTVSEEGEWELNGEDNKEEIGDFEQHENEGSQAEESEYSFELIKSGLKRKRDDLEDDEDDVNVISLRALIGDSEEDVEEQLILEKAATEEEIDDVELLRQLRGDDEDENGGDENEEDDNEKEEPDEEKTDNFTLQNDTASDAGDDAVAEKSAQVNKIDSSNRVCKKRRSHASKFDPSDDLQEKGEGECEEDCNDTSQTPFKYDCNICHKKYKNPTSYRKHRLEKHNKEPDIPDFKCDKCGKILPTERQLGLHARTHLALEDKLDIPCPYCDRKFTKVAVMRQHVRGIHENMKPYICDECGRRLKTLAALSEHKLVHTNDTPFQCEVCQRGFKNKARLKVHLETHNDSVFICSECGVKLNTSRTLKMHMLVHTDAKRFKCEFCPAAFKRTKALKNHLILHTGMRPYKCNFCEKTFSNGSNCRSHKKKMHAQELAEEEAMGKKAEIVTVPKLEELRSSTNVVHQNPRKVQRHHGGLPMHMRQLLIAAEERAKRAEATKQTKGTQQDVVDDTGGEETPTHVSSGGTLKHETDGESEFIVLHDALFEDGEEEDEVETVIYEIIDEI